MSLPLPLVLPFLPRPVLFLAGPPWPPLLPRLPRLFWVVRPEALLLLALAAAALLRPLGGVDTAAGAFDGAGELLRTFLAFPRVLGRLVLGMASCKQLLQIDRSTNFTLGLDLPKCVGELKDLL